MTQEEDKLNQSTESMDYKNGKEHELLESSDDDSAIEEGRAMRAPKPVPMFINDENQRMHN